nr:circularly permuted type 2 ATP-grasp protein [Petropleomorpha daqingensis]
MTAAAAALAAEGAGRGLVVAGWADGRQTSRAVPVDPVPHAIDAAEWASLAAGVEQRHRALNLFLADVYRAAGRRRGDPDRDPEVVRAGVLPAWAVASSPAREPEAVGFAWRDQPRATLAATDVARGPDGRWIVLADSLRVPAGIGYALAARDVVRTAVPELVPPVAVHDPSDAVPLLAGALAGAAPPQVRRAPQVAALSAGEADPAWFEHRVLADALGVPLVRAADLWPRPDGGIVAAVDGERVPVDVLFRRFDDAELAAHRTPGGAQLAALLAEGVRSGTLGLANVPGNGVADDRATYAVVPRMIRFYLGEEPLLRSVPTHVLADPVQWAEVRSRLHELVLTPVDAYGGGSSVVGPQATTDELAQLQAEVAAAPHRFVAAEPVVLPTVPTLVGGALVPRPVDLRVFSVAGASGTRVLPCPLTRVGPSPATRPTGAAIKPTWVLT